jgi:molybdopterin-guanine dinucleotide biosynthesis protein A
MGRDKASIVLGGRTLAKRVADELSLAGCAPVVAIGGATQELPTVADSFPGDGPLGGIVTALEHFYGHDAVCIVATDLATLDATTIRALRRSAAQSGADVAVARTDRLEPLCAVWRPVVAPYLRACLEAGLRAVHGVFGQLDIVEIDVDPGVLLNVNTPDDLRSVG